MATPGTPGVGFGCFTPLFFPVEILSWGLLLGLCFFVGTFWVGSSFCLLRRIVEYVTLDGVNVTNQATGTVDVCNVNVVVVLLVRMLH